MIDREGGPENNLTAEQQQKLAMLELRSKLVHGGAIEDEMAGISPEQQRTTELELLIYELLTHFDPFGSAWEAKNPWSTDATELATKMKQALGLPSEWRFDEDAPRPDEQGS